MQSRFKNNHGFSLIELMITISILAVLASIALPSYGDAMASNRRSSATNDLITSLNYARTESVRKNNIVIVCPSSDGSTCASTGGWDQGWIVFEDLNGDRDKDNTDTVLRYITSFSDSVSILADGGISSEKEVVFTSTGAVGQSAGAVVTTGTIRVCSTTHSSDVGRARDLILLPSGQVVNDSNSVTNSVTSGCAI